MDSFIWKNQDSYLDYGIVINTKPPLVRAEKNVDEIEVPGRDGDLTIDYATYKPITFPFVCTLLDDSNIDNVMTWLDGYSDLTLSWQNDRSYKAKMINRIDISQSLETFGEFPLLFKAQPFALMLNSPLITLTTAGSIYNGGTCKSKPVIKVYGTGLIDININDTYVRLTNVVDYVTIDSDLIDCYKDAVLKNNDMLGDFPVLEVGNNDVQWIGTVTKIEVTPNFRYL